MDKAELRALLRQKRSAMKRAEILRLSEQISHKLFARPEWKRAEAIYTYMSYRQEVSTQLLFARALQERKRVAVPRVENGEMHFYWLCDPAAAVVGYRGILEPPEEAVPANDKTALVIAPGLAFSASGQRLGYGGGFYDRFLAAEPEHFVIGLCYCFQYFDELPVQAHDQSVNLVLCAEN